MNYLSVARLVSTVKGYGGVTWIRISRKIQFGSFDTKSAMWSYGLLYQELFPSHDEEEAADSSDTEFVNVLVFSMTISCSYISSVGAVS